MNNIEQHEAWFVTGSQQLYGDDALEQVARHAQEIAAALTGSAQIPISIICKPVMTSPEAIRRLCQEANATKKCVGLIAWMHTFSPGKMWIGGLQVLDKPLLHFHTQYNRDIPWSEIDMDFMNLNQSAHGGREFGFICTRMGFARKVVVGHWSQPDVQTDIGVWVRAASGWLESRGLAVARFGDNMRHVAVTEGDKVEAQMQYGWSVNGYGVGDLVAVIDEVTDAEVDRTVLEYKALYRVSNRRGIDKTLRDAARIEIGMRHFLEAGGFRAFTTTFEDLHGLAQLPGLAAQRLMAEGYGFGAEGDWKTAALVRIMKVMGEGLGGGTSFMEDYTYHFDPAGAKVLGAHMLEVCPSIALGPPSLEVNPLAIGGKEDPARLVFDARPGPAVNASLIDLGNHFRLIVNEIDVVAPDEALPRLPVARALWKPKPSLAVAAAAWILAGGAHHTSFSQSVTASHLEDFALMTGTGMLLIDDDTVLRTFRKELQLACLSQT